MKYLKAILITPFIWIAAKMFGFLYKDELKQLTNSLKKAEELKNQKRDQVLNELNTRYQSMSKDERQKIESYAKLQNEVIAVYMKYCKEIRNVDGPEMEGIADLWVQTVNGLNKTFQHAFSHKDDMLIKQHLYAVEQECQILLDTNQEILPGYKGPIGNA